MVKLPSPKWIAFVLLFAAAATCASAQGKTAPNMTLVVDETQAARRIAFVHEEIGVQPGPLALAYPSWIPGEHGPTGPLNQMAALRIHAGETTLRWVRDPDNIFVIHVDVPPSTPRITVDFDTLLENTVSAHQLLLAWNTTILYPLNIDKLKLMIEPTIVLPRNWKQGSSLRVTSESGGRLKFAPVSLERLIDSPVLAGEFFRSVPLKSQWPAQLEITGNSQAAVDKADDAHAFDLFGKLVDQDKAMFGFRHWQALHILISQSAAAPFDGLEHEDSPWNAIEDAGLSKKDVLQKVGWPLLAHEQSHSWDGKYRRPGELYSKPNYQGPERTSLLWVYEGLNEYIGMLLATRAGFNDETYMRDYLALTAAYYVAQPARESTALVDTATEDWVLRGVKGGWTSLRRSQDYYDEGALIWLRADTIIREKTQDQRTLDDFLRSFLGQRDTDTIVAPYTREDVEAALSAICPYDWHAFFESHIYQVNSKPPTDGLEAAGWRIVYNDTPEPATFWDELPDHPEYFGWHSIGMFLNKDGTIFDVLPGSPAYQAGLGPQMKILAVNGRAYSGDVMNESISHPHDCRLILTVDNFNTAENPHIAYPGGLRHPHLERIPGSRDYLSEILKERGDKAP